MAANDQKQDSVEKNAAAYVAARGKNGRMISTGHAARAMREEMPDCALSDREIADIVAQIAVNRGHNVSFDFHKEEVSLVFGQVQSQR